MNNTNKLDPNKLHVIPFGGCGEFGMNMTAYIQKKKLFLVDAGTLFPDPKMLGVSSIIPHADHFIKQYDGVEAYIITHGHEDHIGSLLYFYRKWPAPIYATRWTVELIKRKFEERGESTKDVHLVKAGETVAAFPLKIRYIHVNHSIPDACSLLITTTENQKVFHTGDFKIDHTPVGTTPINLKELKAIGQEKVDLLIADSTNSKSPGPSPSEQSVYKPLEKLICGARGRVLLSTFASNLWRLKVIVDICIKNKKKLAIFGRGMLNCIELGARLGYVDLPEGLLVEPSRCKSVPDNQLVCLVSGSQGEFRSALPRIANGEHREIKLKPSDLIILSARIIPGNEKSIFMVCDKIKQSGAKIITASDNKEIHVSGHAYKKDLETFINLLKPIHYLPVHGTFSHLQGNSEIGKRLNYKQTQRTLIKNGDILQVDSPKTKIVGHVDIGEEFVDQDSYETMAWPTLRNRLQIGEFGLALVSAVFSKKRKKFLSPVEIDIQGIAIPLKQTEKEWSVKSGQKLEQHLVRWIERSPELEHQISDEARNYLRRHLFRMLGKKPVVMAKIHLV